MTDRPSLLDALRETLKTGQMPVPGQVRQPATTTDDTLAQDLRRSLAVAPTAPTARVQRQAAQRLQETDHTYGQPDARERFRQGFRKSLAEALDEPVVEEPLVPTAGLRLALQDVPLPFDVEEPHTIQPVFPQADEGGCELPTTVDGFPPFAYVCGSAGVGKTFWAKTLASRDDGCLLAATTGIAAVNLGEGVTINSLLRYYHTASLRDAYTGGFLEAQLKKLRRSGLRRILLDEVSMLDGDQLTILSRAIDNCNQDRADEDPDLGLILVGDFAQLPPVEAPFAFESAEWDRYAKATYRLEHIRRQSDRDFTQALHAVRRGDGMAALEYFRDRLIDTTEMGFDGPTLVAKNAAVDKYNQLRMDPLRTEIVRYGSSRWGKLRPEWGGPPKPPSEWAVPEVLQLKPGCRVMVLANKNVAPVNEPAEYLYINGDLGTFTGPDPTETAAGVTLDRTGERVLVVPLTRDNLIPLEPGRRQALRDEGHPERIQGKWESVGGITYLPLRLAYASTVHKSQGLTLDKVQVNIRDHFFRTPGMLYVSLSRCRTAEGLRIVGTPEGFRARCTVSPKVVPWL